MKLNNYIAEYHYDGDQQSVCDQIEGRGGRVCSITKVPFSTLEGNDFGTEYVVLYQCTEELSIEVKT